MRFLFILRQFTFCLRLTPPIPFVDADRRYRRPMKVSVPVGSFCVCIERSACIRVWFDSMCYNLHGFGMVPPVFHRTVTGWRGSSTTPSPSYCSMEPWRHRPSWSVARPSVTKIRAMYNQRLLLRDASLLLTTLRPSLAPTRGHLATQSDLQNQPTNNHSLLRHQLPPEPTTPTLSTPTPTAVKGLLRR